MIRTTPWEVSRDVKLHPRDESEWHTLDGVRSMREAFAKNNPEGRLTWGFTLNALDDKRKNYAGIRDYVVQCQQKYGDEVSYFPGYFPAMYLPRERVNREMTEAIEIISNYDIVADGSDNFATRYLVNDACYFAKRPLVFAAVGPFDGHLTTFRGHERDEAGNPKPNYRCLFPEAPPPGTVAPCSEAGILGAVAGVMGTLQAVEVLKELLSIGESLAGRLLLYDALQARFSTLTYAWDPENPLSGREPRFHDLSHHREAMAEANG